MMEFEYSPRHSPGHAAHLLSPAHAHSTTIDGFTSIGQIRRSLSRSPSKPARYSTFLPRSSNASPQSPISPSGLSRTYSADAPTQSAKPRFSVKRAGPVRTTARKTSPNSPLRRALSDNSNQANASPRTMRKPSAGDDQENMDCSTGDTKEKEWRDDPVKLDFLRPDRLLQPVKQEHASPVKSSPLKRSDGIMNLEAASFGSPRYNKRRSLHGVSLGSNFNVFEQGLDGTHSDSADSSEERDSRSSRSTSSEWTNAATSSPQRRPFSLRKSTLQQRTGSSRTRALPDANREISFGPALTRARSRMSLDGSLPLRTYEVDSPFHRSTVNDPPVQFHPPVQRLHQSAPKPHPLSHALTPSSSSSNAQVEQSQGSRVSTLSSLTKPDIAMLPPRFSKSLPVGAARPTKHSADTTSSQASSQESYATPEAYKMAKPLPQAFMSTGLISKRNRNVDVGSVNFFGSTHMPDTPSKKAHVDIVSTPAPSGLGNVNQPLHEFGSPSTPFNARTSKVSPEAFGKGASIFGSRLGAPQSSRRRSYFGIDGEDESVSPPHQLESQSSNDDLPPTPTKSTSTTTRPQSKGKSTSLRSSLFGRRTSLGPDTFASPAAEVRFQADEPEGKHFDPMSASLAVEEARLLPTSDEPPPPFITLTACTAATPPRARSRSFGLDHYEEVASSPLAIRSIDSTPPLRTHSDFDTETLLCLATVQDNDKVSGGKSSPHTPQDDPKPGNSSSILHLSFDRQPQTSFQSSRISFPPATPTGPREQGFSASIGPGQSSSGYFANDVDTALTSRFGQVTALGLGEFSQVYRVEKPLGPNAVGLPRTPRSAGRVWAVKKSRKPYSGNKDRQRKMREVELLRALRGHEHLVEFVDAWESKNHLYIQTEFCENGNLKDFLMQAGYKGRLDDFRIWKILLEISQGIRSIHDAGYIHLDLKPANVFIDWEGVLKIGDFGLGSRWPAPSGLDGEGDREYIGPEVLSGRFDKPADIFSLGMIMLEIAGNIVLPDNGTSWQRLRAGDMSDLPSLTWSSESSLVRDESGDPVELMDHQSAADDDSDLSFLRPRMPRCERSHDLTTPPNFMVDPSDPEALDRIVQWMICPDPDARPDVHQLLNAYGALWTERRRRAGATVYEGTWGPADDVLEAGGDVEMAGM